MNSGEQLVKKSDVFRSLTDVESFIKSLEARHHPLKVYKSESVESYNKKVSSMVVFISKFHCYRLFLVSYRLKMLRTI